MINDIDESTREYYLNQLGVQRYQPRSSLKNQVDTSVQKIDWETLKQQVRECRACDLCQNRTQTVFGVGNQSADLLVVGEAPGFYEDQQGEPFVGRAGKLLDALLFSVGLAREQIYIANVLKCRPPENRDPRVEEVIKCTPYLKQQIALMQPKLIVAVGRHAAHSLLETTQSLASLRNQIHHYGSTPLIVSYHPAYLLRTPRDKAKALQDWWFIAREMQLFAH
jgi:uracil-DNA glycosylase